MFGPSVDFRLTKVRLAGWLSIAVVLAAAIWPFMYTMAARRTPPAGAPVAVEPAATPLAAVPSNGCSACPGLRSLARRFAAREQGAARRYTAAANALSVASASPSGAQRRQWEAALRAALDDRRGAARFGDAVRAALRDCESGPGCGTVPLDAGWPDQCPPEDPVLTQEVEAIGMVVHRLSKVASKCAAAACPLVACESHRRAIDLMQAMERDLAALARVAPAPDAVGPAKTVDALAVLEEVEQWRVRVATLFLGGARPSAQMRQVAAEAGGLADRLNAVATSAGEALAGAQPPGVAGAPPLAAMRTVAVRLLRLRAAMEGYADATVVTGPARDAALGRARARAAAQYRAVLVDAARLRFRLERGAGAPDQVPRACSLRRRGQIARARGQIRAARAALYRCRVRAACRIDKTPAAPPPDGEGEVDRISLYRARVDSDLARLAHMSRAMTVGKQAPVIINTEQDRYRSGEAVAVRMDLRRTACMAEPGAWVGLFPGAAPRASGPEVAGVAVRRIPLRGRPWEEVLFEAPADPGIYEVRTYRAAGRGGAMTGMAKIVVTPLGPGCDGFNGRWATNFGELRLTVRDAAASGSYKRREGYRAGFLTGEIKGRVLMGQWRSDLGGGGTRLVLSEDGRSFTGTWSHFRDEFAGTGTWNGKCIAGGTLPDRK